MKITTTVLLALCLMTVSLKSFSQTQPTFEKKMIKDDSGNIYWNLKLPVYIQISSAADGKNAVGLTNVKSESMKKYAVPLYFDGHGVHYLRHLDSESPLPEHEVAYAINVDGIAPKTKFTLTGAPVYYKEKLFFGKGLSGAITATDEMSGVEASHQSIDGAEYSAYTSSINFNQEKEYAFKYFSADRVGNVEAPQSKVFTVDLSAPVSKHEVTIDHLEGNILSPRSKMTLTSTDNLSGVKKIEYYFDSNKAAAYMAPLSPMGLTDGEHTLSYLATDQVSNVEELKKLNFYYDKTVPEVKSALDANFFVKNGKTYVAKASKISLSATDNKAGVKEVYYQINGGAVMVYTEPFTLPAKQGSYQVKFSGKDNVNNKGALMTNDQLASVFLDDTPPALSHLVGLPKVFSRDTLFITKNSTIQLVSNDLESGSAKIEYQLDKGATATYSETFKVAEEGVHSVSYTGFDQVNNSATRAFLFLVDNTGPEIFSHMSLDKLGTQKLADKEKEVPVYASGTLVYLAATDQLVGTKSIFYSIDNKPEVIYGKPVQLLEKGIHVLKVRSVDHLGNETVMELMDFVIQ